MIKLACDEMKKHTNMMICLRYSMKLYREDYFYLEKVIYYDHSRYADPTMIQTHRTLSDSC